MGHEQTKADHQAETQGDQQSGNSSKRDLHKLVRFYDTIKVARLEIGVTRQIGRSLRCGWNSAALGIAGAIMPTGDGLSRKLSCGIRGQLGKTVTFPNSEPVRGVLASFRACFEIRGHFDQV